MWDFPFTAIPNAVGDDYLPDIGPTAFAVLYALARHTLGFQREESDQSLRQLAEYTGLSVNTIRSGLDTLIKSGLIRQTYAGGFRSPARYAIVTHPDSAPRVSNSDTLSRNDTGRVSNSDTPRVSKFDTTNRKKKKVERKTATAAAVHPRLKAIGLGTNARTLALLELPHFDDDYAAEMLAWAERAGREPGLAIKKIEDGDPVPGPRPVDLTRQIPAEYSDIIQH